MPSLINSANAHTISEVFNPDSKIKYVIPKYQREYAWKREHVEELLNDLLENQEGYFLGTILCVNKTTDALKEGMLEIIDGQQRLTTISLLYAAIYKRYSEMNNDDDEFKAEKVNLKNRLMIKHKKNEIKLILSSQNNNFEDYKAILNEIGIYNDPTFKKPANLGNRRLYKIYNYILKRISSISDDEIKRFLDKINSAVIVKIEVNNYSDAYTLFESLNNRGLPLSAMDLIKNKILSEIDKRHKSGEIGIDIDEAFELWKRITENIEDYGVQERFIRQYYNAFRYDDKIRVKDFPRATKSVLIKIYEQLIERDPEFILNELVSKSVIYNRFISPIPNGELYYDLLDLLHVGAAPSYTLLLYLFSKYDDTNFLKEVVKFLVKYFVRRNITDFPATRDLDRIFMGLVDTFENSGEIDVNFIVSYLAKAERFADIETFKNKIIGDIYTNNTAMARFILCKIEESHMTKETWKDLWIKDKSNKYVWTIEHIFPEGRNIPKDWIWMITNGDEERAKELQEKCVHKLGNLTLTAYNKNLSNFSFIKKRDRKDDQGNYIGYKNGLYLNRKLAEKDKWTILDIERRTKELMREVLELFAVEGEKIGDIEFNCSSGGE
ncbi:DUF262 domain-containing protein [Candidatus Bathyarchaeota archaeon]|nr:MAG: DUF262 domain-containing protein [Candidatus Bathyarchaeota archaeon]